MGVDKMTITAEAYVMYCTYLQLEVFKQSILGGGREFKQSIITGAEPEPPSSYSVTEYNGYHILSNLEEVNILLAVDKTASCQL